MKLNNWKHISFFLISIITIIFFIKTDFSFAQANLLLKQSQSNEKNKETTSFSNEDLQKTIDILEDTKKRDELIKTLKLIKASQDAFGQPNDLNPVNINETTKDKELEHSLKSFKEEIFEILSKFRINFKDSRNKVERIFTSLIEKDNIKIWVPFVRNIMLWALGCLIVAFIFYRKYLRVQTFHGTIKAHLINTIKYFSLTALPISVLILSLILLPDISKQATNNNFIESLKFVQMFVTSFFIIFSILYLAKRFAVLFFSINNKGEMVAHLSPKVAIYLLRAWVSFCNYSAFFIFIKWCILNHLASSNMNFVLTGLLILPFPAFGTKQIINFHKLINEPGFKATNKKEVFEKLQYPYTFNKIIKTHWAAISIFYIWMVSAAAIFLHDDQGAYFIKSFVVSIIVIFMAITLILMQRWLFKKAVNPNKINNQGKNLILAIDTLTNTIVWFSTLIIVMIAWGFPLDKIATNPLTKDILSRLVGIAVTLTIVVLVLRFNRMITEWILASPELLKSRTWRTMTPILQTLIKVLTIFIALIVTLERLGVNIGPILAGAGILGLGLGMGAQSLIKDIINGVSILLMDAVAIGDIVEINEIRGVVQSIGLRTFRIRDIKGNLVVIPNSSVDIIINLSKDFSQDILDILIPYDSDTDQAISLIKQASSEMEQDPIWNELIINPVEIMGVQMLDERGTTIRARTHTVAGYQFNVSRELRLRIKRKLMDAGFKAPYQKFIIDQKAREDTLEGITKIKPKKQV